MNLLDLSMRRFSSFVAPADCCYHQWNEMNLPEDISVASHMFLLSGSRQSHCWWTVWSYNQDEEPTEWQTDWWSLPCWGPRSDKTTDCPLQVRLTPTLWKGTVSSKCSLHRVLQVLSVYLGGMGHSNSCYLHQKEIVTWEAYKWVRGGHGGVGPQSLDINRGHWHAVPSAETWMHVTYME